MKCFITSSLVIFILAIIQPLSAEGDPVAGKNKSANCMGCHGVKGYFNVYPTYRVPKLGGQHPEYIVASLKAYQEETRDHDTMHAQAAQLSEQDMQDIAAFLSQHGSDSK